jgi:hypothetical protein
MNIKILQIVEEFKSSFEDERAVGVYKLDVSGRKLIVTRNGNNFMAIQHGLDGDSLSYLTSEFKEELLKVLEK